MGTAELIETWTLYAVGSCVIFARIGCRLRIVGLSGFKPDDYLIIFSWVSIRRFEEITLYSLSHTSL
jgi:hypothetical protein